PAPPRRPGTAPRGRRIGAHPHAPDPDDGTRDRGGTYADRARTRRWLRGLRAARARRRGRTGRVYGLHAHPRAVSLRTHLFVEEQTLIRLRTLLPILCLMIAAGCGRSTATPEDSGSEARTVAVVQSQRKDVVQSITLPGDLVGFYEAALHSKVTGYLRKIDVDKGDWVKQGQVLASIEVPELDQNLARARAQLDIARITWERLDRVRTSDPKLVAKEDVDIAYSKYMEAKASFGELETMVGYTQIIAPFDGVITGRFADPGALIRAGGGDLGISGSGVNVSAAALEG